MFHFTSEPLPPPLQVLTMICGYMASQAVYTTAELRLADLVQDGPKSAVQLAHATQTNEKNLSRLLRALVSLGVFSEPSPGYFGSTPLSVCLQSDHPRTLYNLARLLGGWQWKTSGELTYSVRTGTPAFKHLFGKEMWRYFAEDAPEAGALFNRAMTSLAGPADEQLVDACDFSGIQTLVDVGGGHGGFLITALKRNPTLKGILFDLPEVIEEARELIAGEGLSARIELVAGDFFQGVPEGGDSYFIRQIIKDWEDRECTVILRNCMRAMNSGGTILVAEAVLEADKTDLLTRLTDLVLMVDLAGRERTATEFRRLFATAGLALKRIVPTKSNYKIMELEAKIDEQLEL